MALDATSDNIDPTSDNNNKFLFGSYTIQSPTNSIIINLLLNQQTLAKPKHLNCEANYLRGRRNPRFFLALFI